MTLKRQRMATFSTVDRLEVEIESTLLHYFSVIKDADQSETTYVPIHSKTFSLAIDYVKEYSKSAVPEEIFFGTIISKASLADLIELANAADYLIVPCLLEAATSKLAQQLDGLLHPTEVALRLTVESTSEKIDMDEEIRSNDFTYFNVAAISTVCKNTSIIKIIHDLGDTVACGDGRKISSLAINIILFASVRTIHHIQQVYNSSI